MSNGWLIFHLVTWVTLAVGIFLLFLCGYRNAERADCADYNYAQLKRQYDIEINNVSAEEYDSKG